MGSIRGEELAGDVGAPDVGGMEIVRDVFLRGDPLVTEVEFDSVLSPREIRLTLDDGIGDADSARIDVTWYTSGAYSFHDTDSEDANWRFDRHPNPHSPEKHFHAPPDARAHDAEPSCITVEEPRLVALAVLKLWRRAYETESLAHLNTAENPP
ncbi:hypothetical protein [Haloterrigena alkaliphila]|uniref:Uncharacterized protein n=1 Tax=Haloterrigena alkaliphila TaxID=2816475 RepID=A0A8A2VJX4_9EURY|nr:hypothetical protein [Haloterrigena alkaliphila]QSX01011.1 hypothetical protein J0X25_08665 [Haloterrigena alkaliphila]